MSYTHFVGIDNGISGSIGIVSPNGTAFIATPTIKCKSYTKEEQNIHRIDWKELLKGLSDLPKDKTFVLMERPLVNPRAFKATQSALRALEATLICIEYNLLDFEYIDSKTWQREFISSAVIGHDEMKEASMMVGLTLFPNNGMFIKRHKDADGLLIAEYARRKHLNLLK